MSQDNTDSLPNPELKTPDQAPEGTLADRDPGEVAAMMFKQFGPRFKQVVMALDKQKARKLAVCLATFPLENENMAAVEMLDPAFKEAYALGDRLIQAKMLLINELVLSKMKDNETKEGKDNG